MSAVLTAIAHYAHQTPQAIAIEGDELHLSYSALHVEIETLSQHFRDQGYQRLGLLMDNGPAWAVIDLAAMSAGVTLIPIPAFFTAEQALHALSDAGVQALMTDQSARVIEQFPGARLRPQARIAAQSVWLASLPQTTAKNGQPPVAADIAKITYTSGTTGSPKGVCLSPAAMDGVATSLRNAIPVTSADRHLCLLPLAVLLENIGGIYAPLLAGACCVIPGLNKVGMQGATELKPHQMLEAIATSRATSIILLPQMLQALIAMVSAGQPAPATLRFIAVGGAPVSARLLDQAKELGLPVFEGYGLSECASVVAVNTPGHHRPGSVGRLLPHVQLAFADDGEILLKGKLFAGYLNQPPHEGGWYASGDLGYQDSDGYLYLSGRKKSCFITSFGRNVAPEWVERELTLSPAIAQAVVFGEAQPFNVAVITPHHANDQADSQIHSAVFEANHRLPDYARVSAWMVSDEPFSVANQLFTATGRPRREAIWKHYSKRLNNLYDTHGASRPKRSQHAIL